MQRDKVSSTALLSVGYDPLSCVLEIEFRSGRIFQYYEVPRSTYEWMMQSKDKGGLFNRLIRDRFAEKDVTQAPEPQDLLALLQASIKESPPE